MSEDSGKCFTYLTDDITDLSAHDGGSCMQKGKFVQNTWINRKREQRQ